MVELCAGTDHFPVIHDETVTNIGHNGFAFEEAHSLIKCDGFVIVSINGEVDLVLRLSLGKLLQGPTTDTAPLMVREDVEFVEEEVV